MDSQGLTLVVGGTGKTGRRVGERLAGMRVPIRLAARSSACAFDWDDEATWPRALEGVSRVYLTYAPDLGLPEAALRIRRFTALARARTCKKIVLLSGRGEPKVFPSEQAVRESGMSFTILRAAFFCQNFSEGQLHEPLLAGELAFPAGETAEPFVDLEDVADVAVAALTEERHAGRTYELTGPELLTFGEAVAQIGRACRRKLRYVPVTKAEYAASLAPYLPAHVVCYLSELFEQLLDGHNASVSEDVERILGRSARSFAEFAGKAAGDGAWG